jgi:hypothetical protein
VESKNRLDAVCLFGEGTSRLPTQFYFDNSALQKASITLYQGDSLKAAGEAFGLGFDWLKGSDWGVDAPYVEIKDRDGKVIPYSKQTADRVSRDYVEMIGQISSSESDNLKGFVVTLFQQSERPIQGTMLCNTVYRSSRGIFFVTMWLLNPALPNQTCPVAREEIEATSIPAPEALSGIKHK